MVDTVANRQEVCEAWCVTPSVVSGEDCIGMLTGLSLYGAADVDNVILFVLVYVTPCSSNGGWTCCLPTGNIIVEIVRVYVLCGVCACCLCGPCRGMTTTMSVVEMFCFFDAGKSLKVFPKMIEQGFVK